MAAYPGANKLQSRTRRIVGPFARRLWTIECRGYENLPDHGPAILCPNHISFLDSAFLMVTMPRNISFVGKAEYLDDWKTRHLFPALGMIPIDRSGGSRSEAALASAEAVLRRGELFGIYPEGTRSRDGSLYKGRTGAARLAMRVGCPILPVGIVGTDLIQPVEARFPKIGRTCSITIGRAVSPDRYVGRGPEHLAWRSMIDEVMFEVREMTGQRYIDRYAGHADDVAPAVRPGGVADDLDAPDTGDARDIMEADDTLEAMVDAGRFVRPGIGSDSGASGPQVG